MSNHRDPCVWSLGQKVTTMAGMSTIPKPDRNLWRTQKTMVADIGAMPRRAL